MGRLGTFRHFIVGFLCVYGDKRFLRALAGNMICKFCLRE